jgi:hypothetical protein
MNPTITYTYFGLFIVVVHDPAAAPKDAPNQATDCRVQNSKDVPVMWIDHISTQGGLLGVRQVSFNGSVFHCREMTRFWN